MNFVVRGEYLLVVLLLLFLNGNCAVPFKVLSNWNRGTEKKGIKISYRWIMLGDSIKTRETCSVFYVSTASSKILELFYNEENLLQWCSGLKSCMVFDKKEENWYAYYCYDIPWPFQKQDAVYKIESKVKVDSVILDMKSVSNKISKVKGVKRLNHAHSRWIFTRCANNQMKVEVRSISATEPVVPRFIQDKIVYKVLIKSFLELKRIVEADEERKEIWLEKAS